MQGKRKLLVFGFIIVTGQLLSQANSSFKSCRQILYKDLFKSIHLPQDQRRDDILYLKVLKKQFGKELQVQSLNTYIDNEDYISSIFKDADISCLAIGEAFEIMIVLNRELQSDSLMNLPATRFDIERLIAQFSKTLDVSTKLEFLLLTLSEPRCVPNPPRDIGSTKSLSQIIREELVRLRQPIKLKKI